MNLYFPIISLLIIICIVFSYLWKSKKNNYQDEYMPYILRIALLLLIFITNRNENVTETFRVYFSMAVVIIIVPVLYVSYRYSKITKRKQKFVTDIIAFIIVLFLVLHAFLKSELLGDWSL